MPNNLPLAGKTVILTGTSATLTVQDKVRGNGGQVVIFPLIRVQEFFEQDGLMLTEIHRYNWLIFTSQNGVETFVAKLLRANIDVRSIQAHIAAVGEKTAQCLERAGLTVHFIPTTYSADAFVQEFQAVAGAEPRCLFLRGSLAKATIQEGLPYEVVAWTVYETVENLAYVDTFINSLQQRRAIVIFASPSAVAVFERLIAPIVGWHRVDAAAIGHITTKALMNLGVRVYVQPKIYTMDAVIEQLILEETKS